MEVGYCQLLPPTSTCSLCLVLFGPVFNALLVFCQILSQFTAFHIEECLMVFLKRKLTFNSANQEQDDTSNPASLPKG